MWPSCGLKLASPDLKPKQPIYYRHNRPRWPHGLRRGSAAARLLGLRVRISPGDMDVCECCVLSSRGLHDGPFTRPDESAECDVSENDLGISTLRMSRPTRAVEP